MTIALGHSARDEAKLSDGRVIESAVAVVAAVELHSCPSKPKPGAALYRLLVPDAHAHVPSSSTRLGDPAASDLLDGRPASRVIGELSVPLERFCHAFVVFAPADDDVLNVTEISDDELVGSTLVTRLADGTTDSSDAVRAVRVDLVDPNTGAPLQFDTAGSGPMLLFDIAIPDTPTVAPSGPLEGTVAGPLLDQLDVTLRRFDTP